jgi:DNA-binding NarL/FixJ family response regulator
VGFTCCYILEACENVRDFSRASEWLARVRAADQEIGVLHFASMCRDHYIAILTWRGQYAEAEEEIAAMRREIAEIAPLFGPLADVRLGELRRRQGRLEEAAALLRPQTAHLAALLALASLALDEQQPDRAVEFSERYLRRLSPNERVRRVHGLDLLLRARAAVGALAALPPLAAELDEIAASIGTRQMQAVAIEARAIVSAAAERLDEARMGFEDAIDRYEASGAPLEAACARLRLAEVRLRQGRGGAAREDASAALATADRIGAGLVARKASALLSSSGPPSPGTVSGLTAREIEVLRLVARGLNNQEIGERLFVSAFTVKRHVANILTKLDVPSRAAAAAFAARHGLTG